jgi:hypothetical protein
VSWRVPKNIPSDWIVGHKIYRADTTTREWSYTRAEDMHTLFDEVVQTKSVPVIKQRMFVVVLLDVEED